MMICNTPLSQRKMSVVRCIADASVMKDMSFYDFLDFANYPKNKEYLTKARQFAKHRKTNADDAEQYKFIKTHKLQAICITGTFNERKKECNMIQHSGLICVDIDAGDNPHITDWEQAKADISQYGCIAYCGLSLSGDGLFCIIPIDKPLQVEIPPVGASDADRMRAIEKVKDLQSRQFKALQISFAEMGYTIDKACHNLERLRVLSFDPNAYRNDNADVYTHIVPKQKRITQQAPRQYRFSPVVSEYRNLEDWLIKHRVEYTPNGYRYNVVCPWEHLHSSHTGVKQTCVFEKDGVWCFHCFHSHCADKTFKDYARMVKGIK